MTTSALAPFGPRAPKAKPEQAFPVGQLGSGVVALAGPDLLRLGDELQCQIMSGAQEGTEPREKSQKKPDHGPVYMTQSTGSLVPASC